MMPLCPLSEFFQTADYGLGSEVLNMLSSVSTNDPRQNEQSLLVKQKQQDDAPNVRNNQQPSTLNAQRTDNAERNKVRPENQNSQQAKGASLDVRA
jgi:hypothetical protein